MKGTRQAIALRIAKGEMREGYVVSKDFFLQRNYQQPARKLLMDAKQLILQVSHATERTRVQWIATRFWLEFDVYGDLFQSYALGTRSMKLDRSLS